jgi:hypothetical protein
MTDEERRAEIQLGKAELLREMERVKQRLAEERMHKAALSRSYQLTTQEAAQQVADYWWNRKLENDAIAKAEMDARYSQFAHCGPGDPDWDERGRRTRR